MAADEFDVLTQAAVPSKLASKSLIYRNKLGYNVKEHWLKQHRENLKYIIKTQGKPDIIHGQFTHYGGWVAWLL